MNRFLVVPLARLRILPFFGMKNTFIVIRVQGRKTGLSRYVGINLRKLGDDMYVFMALGRKTQWYKNHLHNPEETRIYYGFKKYKVKIMLIDSIQKEKIMGEYVTTYPKWSRLGIGWNEQDDPSGELLKDYVKTIEIAHINLIKE